MRLLFSFKSTTEVFNMQGVWHLLYPVTHYDSPSGFPYYNWITKMRGEPLPTTWERTVQLCEFNHGNCYKSLVLQCNTLYKQKKILTMKYREMAWMWFPGFVAVSFDSRHCVSCSICHLLRHSVWFCYIPLLSYIYFIIFHFFSFITFRFISISSTLFSQYTLWW